MEKIKLEKQIFIILTIKFLISGLFSSGYVTDLFIPFVEAFSKYGYKAWALSGLNSPYPPLMTLILYVPVKLTTFFDSIYLKNLIFHTPMIIADFVIYLFLAKLLPLNLRRVRYYYLLSPIIFYASFVHTQLDLIPTCFIFASAYYLTKNKNFLAYFLLGISIAVKWHTAVAIPFYLIYSFKRDQINYAFFKYIPLIALPLVVTILPFGSIKEVSNLFVVNERGLLFESYFNIMDLKVYLFPFLYAIAVGATLGFKKINTELFMGTMAMVFMAFVAVVYPNPGWFVWSLPFLSYSFTKNHDQKKLAFALYCIISICYILFFTLFYSHPYNSYENITFLGNHIDLFIIHDRLPNLFFTLLVASMAIGISVVYKSAIQNSLLYKRKFQSFLIGIAGDSGSGKSTLLKNLNDMIGSNLITQLEGDGEHKWGRGDSNWKTLTHLNPKANNLHQQLAHIVKLKHGNSTFRSDYNHQSGKFDKVSLIKSNAFIAIAGLHPFYLKGARKNIDFKIYLDTDESLRRNWKVRRDVEKRGYSIEKILQQLDEREEDSNHYIKPQMAYSDLIIRYIPKEEVIIGESDMAESDLFIEYEVAIDIPIDSYISRIQTAGCKIVSHEYGKDLLNQKIRIEIPELFQPQILQEDFQDFFDEFNMDKIIWEAGIMGLNQTIMMHCIREKYIGDHTYEI